MFWVSGRKLCKGFIRKEYANSLCGICERSLSGEIIFKRNFEVSERDLTAAEREVTAEVFLIPAQTDKQSLFLVSRFCLSVLLLFSTSGQISALYL